MSVDAATLGTVPAPHGPGRSRSAAELAHYPHSGAVFARRVATPGLPPATYWD